ncbi:MAG: ABC transporter ATP-binding protein [Firmicutes bacterium]|nr:ABC transporter ATP-binding protein [Bacillota bacterium]
MTVEVKSLTFSYGQGNVLEDVSFTARPGRLLALLGPNGVGKSTLFRCILGLADHYSGDIFVEGENIRSLTSRALAQRIAYVPQYHYPSFNFSVYDMVLMGTVAWTGGFSAPKRRHLDLVDQALQKLDIDHLRHRGYTHISGGERQLVLIARALVQEAKTLVMDEPTANLDYGNQLKMMAQVKELTREGYTVIVSTHNPDHALWFADDILALSAGKVLAFGPPAQVLTSQLISALYGAEVHIASVNQGKTCICVPELDKNIQEGEEKYEQM